MLNTEHPKELGDAKKREVRRVPLLLVTSLISQNQF